LSLVELPLSTKVHQVSQDKPFKLQPGSWDRFGALSLTFTTKYNKLLFIYYSYNGNTAGDESVAFKVMVDDIELKTARSQTTNSNKISNAVGQGNLHVTPGEHTITLMYRQLSKAPISFEKFDIYQSASLNVLEFDEYPEAKEQ